MQLGWITSDGTVSLLRFASRNDTSTRSTTSFDAASKKQDEQVAEEQVESRSRLLLSRFLLYFSTTSSGPISGFLSMKNLVWNRVRVQQQHHTMAVWNSSPFDTVGVQRCCME
jgi:hypothetical protein